MLYQYVKRSRVSLLPNTEEVVKTRVGPFWSMRSCRKPRGKEDVLVMLIFGPSIGSKIFDWSIFILIWSDDSSAIWSDEKKWCLWSYDIIRCNPICMFLLIPQEIQLLHAAQERSASSQRSLAWEEWYLAEHRPQGRHPAVWGPSKYQEKPPQNQPKPVCFPWRRAAPDVGVSKYGAFPPLRLIAVERFLHDERGRWNMLLILRHALAYAQFWGTTFSRLVAIWLW